MPKNRKEHAKKCCIAGERRKREEKAAKIHRQNIALLQRALDHSEILEAKNPELFKAAREWSEANAPKTINKALDEAGLVTLKAWDALVSDAGAAGGARREPDPIA